MNWSRTYLGTKDCKNGDGPFIMNDTDTNTCPIITAYLPSFGRQNQIYIRTKLQMQPIDHHNRNKFELSEKKNTC